MISWFRYVRLESVPAFEAAGWSCVADLGPVHGFWSVLMKWMGEGDPKFDLPAQGEAA